MLVYGEEQSIEIKRIYHNYNYEESICISYYLMWKRRFLVHVHVYTCIINYNLDYKSSKTTWVIYSVHVHVYTCITCINYNLDYKFSKTTWAIYSVHVHVYTCITCINYNLDYKFSKTTWVIYSVHVHVHVLRTTPNIAIDSLQPQFIKLLIQHDELEQLKTLPDILSV